MSPGTLKHKENPSGSRTQTNPINFTFVRLCQTNFSWAVTPYGDAGYLPPALVSSLDQVQQVQPPDRSNGTRPNWEKWRREWRRREYVARRNQAKSDKCKIMTGYFQLAFLLVRSTREMRTKWENETLSQRGNYTDVLLFWLNRIYFLFSRRIHIMNVINVVIIMNNLCENFSFTVVNYSVSTLFFS